MSRCHQLALVGRFTLFPGISHTILVSIAALYLIERLLVLWWYITLPSLLRTIVSILLKRNILIFCNLFINIS